ncbi:DAK2 domain-containing protein [Pseudoflavonifractor sp. SW1122]|uniref:DAK2 domain-containing protein n=1 Tax=Pseudoflavonifractor sp. SW1122 TaxID=2530044 RepID=UPI001439FC0A|nr:DAK2 domain-containing protein [Pseudoflavonifractor sp. SW1122]NJE74650.1 DAK2 domain-containing protein [Pseudoflavonifractor sp. SW1122]
MIDIIDGALFQRMVVHAAASINAQKQSINELNVFPVPDGDTGTNMSLTIGTAAAEAKKKPATTVAQAAATNASALLRGARGNSGVILSLLFRGVSKALKDHDTADGVALAAALHEGVSAAYKAVMKPAEGTILTVSRLAAKAAAEAAQEQNSAEHVLEAAIAHGQEALAETINQNPVLKKAGVVDAGGKGFLIILQGMLDEMRGIPAPQGGEDDAPKAKDKADFATFETGDITFGYCTEFICSRDNTKDPQLLRSFLNGMGDSLVLVDDDEIIKVHVHTNHPGRVLEEALTYGALLTVKIENMREQHTEILEEAKEAQEEEPGIVPAEKKYGVVAVCAGGGLASVFRDLGVDGIISGGQTMNPSTEDILREIARTPAETVFVLPNNKNIIMAAQQCVGLIEGREVVVIPTRTVPQGISTLLVMDPEGPVQDNVDAMTEAMSHVHTSEVTYAARNSDFDGFAIQEGDYMALSDGQLFGTAKSMEELLENLAQAETQQTAEFINIFYGEDVDEESAGKALALFQRLCPNAEITLLSGGQPVYYYMISAE